MSSDVRPQDDQTVLGATPRNPYASKQSLSWVMENWQRILKTHKGDGLMIGRFIESLSVLAGKSDHDRIRKFFSRKENYNVVIKRSLNKTTESIEINMRLLKRNGCSDGRD
jgi:aminopeptidase N